MSFAVNSCMLSGLQQWDVTKPPSFPAAQLVGLLEEEIASDCGDNIECRLPNNPPCTILLICSSHSLPVSSSESTSAFVLSSKNSRSEIIIRARLCVWSNLCVFYIGGCWAHLVWWRRPQWQVKSENKIYALRCLQAYGWLLLKKTLSHHHSDALTWLLGVLTGLCQSRRFNTLFNITLSQHPYFHFFCWTP